jgi:hypothetical protein
MVALRIERKVVDLIQSVRDTVLFLSAVISFTLTSYFSQRYGYGWCTTTGRCGYAAVAGDDASLLVSAAAVQSGGPYWVQRFCGGSISSRIDIDRVPTLHRRAPQVRHPSSAPCVRPLMWSHSICSADGYAEGSASVPAHHARPHSPRILTNVRRGIQTTSNPRLPLRWVACISIRPLLAAKVEATCQVDKKEPRTSPIIPASSSGSPASSPRPTKRPLVPFVVCAPPPPLATRPQVDGERDWRYEAPLQSTGRRRSSAK